MAERFWEQVGYREAIAEALRLLGVERLVLAIHDSSFPSSPDEEVGRGTPNGEGGNQFLEFCAALGFTGLQLGPQGQTSRHNPSPYDGAFFSRNHLSIALAPLVEGWEGKSGGLLTRAEVASWVSTRPADSGPEAYLHAFETLDRALWRAATRFEPRGEHGVRFREFCGANADWLEADALFHAAACANGHDDWSRWPALDRQLLHPQSGEGPRVATRIGALLETYSSELFHYRFVQFIAHSQHRAFHSRATKLGLKLYADLQIGCSHRDRWRFQPLFLSGYAMGAPPSRTTREGQPWGIRGL